jgi:hypothetical protein
MKRSLMLVVVAFVCAGGIRAEHPSAVVSIDSARYTVGDPIHLRIQLRHEPGVTFVPLIGDTVGKFFVLDRQPLTHENDSVTHCAFTVAAYDSGEAVLPPLVFSYTPPGESAIQTVKTNPLLLHIDLVEIDTTQPIRDLKPPLRIPMTLADIALIAGVTVFVGGASYFIYRLWKKRRERREGIEYVAPPLPAHVLALEQLGALREKRLWQQGMIKEYYSELTDILRRYFEGRYGITALEQTTDEIVRSLDNHLPVNSVRGEIEGILRSADLVKFARFVPALDEHERSLVSAYEIVEKTKPATVPAPGPDEEREKVYVGA